MRSELSHLDKWRKMADVSPESGGLWIIRRFQVPFTVIAAWADGWDHVSISTEHRTPEWDEMCWFKGQFFEPDEVVMQLHPGQGQYVNVHEHCLHLWRPQVEVIPLPSIWMV